MVLKWVQIWHFQLHAAEQVDMQGSSEDMEDKAGAHSTRGRPRLPP